MVQTASLRPDAAPGAGTLHGLQGPGRRGEAGLPQPGILRRAGQQDRQPSLPQRELDWTHPSLCPRQSCLSLGHPATYLLISNSLVTSVLCARDPGVAAGREALLLPGQARAGDDEAREPDGIVSHKEGEFCADSEPLTALASVVGVRPVSSAPEEGQPAGGARSASMTSISP